MFLIKYLNRIPGVRKIELYESYLIILFMNKNVGVYNLSGEVCFLEQGFNTSSIYLIKNKVYSPIYYEIKRENPKWDSSKCDQKAKPIAEAKWPGYLQNQFKGGLKNYTAQTRIASSYGFLQMMYFYAVTDRDYPVDNDHLPEVIMETDVCFTYATNHLKNKFNDSKIKEDFNKSTGWKLGFNNTWRKALIRYNGASKYANEVISNSLNYLPRNK